MSLPLQYGEYDPDTNTYTAVNTGTWANLTAWSEWSDWINLPAEYLTVSSTLEDRGRVSWFNVRTNLVATGANIVYRVFVSNTGEFAGEETITTILSGASNVQAFYGRYYGVEANVRSPGTRPTITEFTVTTTDNTVDIVRGDLVTANLAVVGNSRQIPLDRICSAVTAVQITAHDPSTVSVGTNTADYYLETPETNRAVPVITSKSRTGPTFQLVGLGTGLTANMANPVYRVDARVTALPEQYHDGTNLNVR